MRKNQSLTPAIDRETEALEERRNQIKRQDRQALAFITLYAASIVVSVAWLIHDIKKMNNN